MEGIQTDGATRPAAVPAGTVVVGVDGSRPADQALDWAADQADLEHRALTVIHALGPLATSSVAWLDEPGVNQRALLDAMHREGHDLVDRARDRVLSRHPHLEVRPVLRAVDPREALLELSQDATMVVLGSRGRGPVRSLVLGSVSAGVSRHAACPVVVLRPRNIGVVRRGVLVGVDGTPRSRASLEFAYRQASLRRLPLTVLHAFWDAAAGGATRPVAPDEPGVDDQRLLLAESVSGMTEKYPDVQVRLELVRGLADSALVRLSKAMDLVVVGYPPVRPLARLVYGSVASIVLEHASCIVAVVPEPEVALPDELRDEAPAGGAATELSAPDVPA